MYRALVLCLFLAACATPQERCINDATDAYRSALKERQDIAEALAKGFATQTDWETRRVFTNCRVAAGRIVPCWENESYPVTRRVPVDKPALRQRDAVLARQLTSLEKAAERGTQACLQAFPVET